MPVWLIVAGVVGVALYLSAAPGITLESTLGKYWTVAKLTVTSTGLPNIPGAGELANLADLVEHNLDPIEEVLQGIGLTMLITSGYRSNAVNAQVGGSEDSDHKAGRAYDGIAVDSNGNKALTSLQLAELFLASGIEFDQLIFYTVTYDSAGKPRKGHIHTSYRAEGNRGQVLYWAGPDDYRVPTIRGTDIVEPDDYIGWG